MPNGNCGPVQVSCHDLEVWLHFTGRLPPECVLTQGSGITVSPNGEQITFTTRTEE